MSDSVFQIGQSVELLHKNLTGRVAFVGQTNFSPGKWVGIILDEEKGRNNGTVKGNSYFKCQPNHGLFVRPTQLRALDEGVTTVNCNSPESTTPKTTNMPTTTALSPSVSVLLKPTKISLPRKTEQLFSSSSQLSLNVPVPPAAVAQLMAVRSVTSSVLAVPKKLKKNTLNTANSCCSVKRSSASFVETGFLEILMPQFTPGPPLRSLSVNTMPGNNESGTPHSSRKSSTMEIKELKEQIAELILSLEEQKQQRVEEHAKMNDLNRVKINNEKLLEFKVKIMQQHGALQRELQRSRQEARELMDAKDRYVRELAELNESMELLTLDKEMAEEKYETTQLELDIAKERNDELILDNDLLRAELQSYDEVGNRGESRVDDMQMKKLEQLNQCLKQTVISLRDVLSQDKLELQKATKELDTKQSEIAELLKTKEILSRRIDIMEMQIIDLKEQVDGALGAEAMAETLIELKLELEERVKLLEEEVTELEALSEIHEQIIEGNQELEMDLREEVALLNKTINNLQQKENKALDMIYERDITIKKFRDLVREQNEKINVTTSLSTIDQTTDEKLNENIPRLDYHRQMFSLIKAGGREIEALLNAMHLKLCQMQLDLLLSYMPEEFLRRGGDYDLIELIISFHRVVNKANIISKIINEKFPSCYHFDRDTIFESFSLRRYAFRSKTLYFLSALKLILQQIIACVQNSDQKLCFHAVSYSDEVVRHERTFDEILNLLKTDEIDENSSTESIERVCEFFSHLHTNLMSEQLRCDMIDEQQLYLALVETYELATDCLNVNAELMERLVELNVQKDESFPVLKFMLNKIVELRKRLKTFRLKTPVEFIKFSSLKHSQLQAIKITNEAVGKLINILDGSCRETLKLVASRKSDDSSGFAIDHQSLWKILVMNCFNFRAEVEGDPNGIIHDTINLLDEQISEISNFIDEQQNANISNQNTVYVRSSANALKSRATEFKKQYEDVKQIAISLEAREKEVKTLKYIVKMKQTEYSEMQIRKEFAERNMKKLMNEQDSSVNAIFNYVNNVLNDYTIREYFLVSSLEKLETKIQLLEEIAGKHKKHQEQQQKHMQQIQQDFLSLPSSTSVTNYINNDIIDIDLFAKCLRREHMLRREQQADQWRTILRHLTPIIIPQRQMDAVLSQLEREARRIKNDWILTHIALTGSNLTLTKANICGRSGLCSAKVIEEYLRRNPQKSVETTFRIFPSFQSASIPSK